MESKELNKKMEDHALEPVPDTERQNWLRLSWNTAGIVTTLIQLFLGALVASSRASRLRSCPVYS